MPISFTEVSSTWFYSFYYIMVQVFSISLNLPNHRIFMRVYYSADDYGLIWFSLFSFGASIAAGGFWLLSLFSSFPWCFVLLLFFCSPNLDVWSRIHFYFQIFPSLSMFMVTTKRCTCWLMRITSHFRFDIWHKSNT